MESLGYITLVKASEIKGITADALKKQCQEGRIRGAIKQGKTWFVPHSEIVVRPQQADDRALNLFLMMAESFHGAGITLSVNGLLISGTLISSSEYFRLLRQQINFTRAGDVDKDTQSKVE